MAPQDNGRLPPERLAILRKVCERPGDEELIRSLSIGRVVAVVGSGLPAGYGRPTWTQLLEAARDVALGSDNVNLEESEKKRRREELNDLAGGDGSTIKDTEFAYAIGQICEILGGDEVSEKIKKLTYEAGGYIDIIVDKLKKVYVRNSGATVKKIDDVGIDKTLEDARFSLELNNDHQIIDKPRQRSKKSLVEFIDTVVAIDVLSYVTGRGKGWIELSDVSIKSSIINATILSDKNDPAIAIIKSLNISRFMTTNYDIEIERRLDSLLKYDIYSNADKINRSEIKKMSYLLESSQDLRGTAASIVLIQDSIPDLLEFGTLLGRYDHTVFHLHGRCLKGDKLVVSEGDYQALYLKRHDERQLFREALDIAFGGSTILFVGFGMSEADPLRPLRQFVSDQRKDADRQLFAIMPPRQSADKEAGQKVDLKFRFDTDVIYTHDPFHDEKESSNRVSEIRNFFEYADKARKAVNGDLGEAVKSDKTRVAKGIIQDVQRLIDCISNLDTYIEYHTITRSESSKIIRIMLKLNSFKVAMQDKYVLVSLDIIIQGLVRNLQTVLLCSTLERLNRRKLDWWRAWNEPARARAPWMRPDKARKRATECVVYRRHCVEPSRGQRLARKIGKRHLARLCDALAPAPPPGRRIVVVHGPKGIGRGALFGEITRDPKLLDTSATTYSHAMFVSTAFSFEFASVVDFMAYGFLAEKPPAGIGAFPEHAGKPRLEVLRDALRALASVKEGGRRLICIHDIAALFDRGGKPHGGEYSTHLPLLLGPLSAAVPVDIVLFCSSEPAVLEFMRSCGGYKSAIRFVDLEKGWHPERRTIFENYAGDTRKNGIRLLVLKILEMIDGAQYPFAVVEATVRHLVSGTERSDAAAVFLDRLIERLQRTAAAERPLATINECIDRVAEVENVRWKVAVEILKTLAIFSIAVRADILAASPNIRQVINKKPGEAKPGDDSELSKTVEAALDELHRLELVFVLKPGATAAKERYAVHRDVQTLFLRRLGGEIVDTGETNYFQVGLYAAQPTDVPILHHKSYMLIEGLVDGLVKTAQDGLDGRLELLRAGSQGEPDDREGGLLRAAFAAARSCLSLACITRFRDRLQEEPRPRHSERPHYLTRHRKRLRDIYDAVREHGAHEKVDHPALYRDELIWLQNERGLIALAQGRLYEATPLLRSALEQVRRVEYDNEDSATLIRVKLNLALLDIERGRIRTARATLEQIMRIEAHHRGIIWQGRARVTAGEGDRLTVEEAVARGYLGLVEHLSGRVEIASQHLRASVDALAGMGRYRSVAIFSRHLASTLLKLGDRGQARREVRRAVAAAVAGGQQDILHLARVTEAAIALRDEDGLARARHNVAAAEEYADDMDMPRLKTEALILQAEIALANGDTKLAGALTAKGLTVATRHGLMLRKISGLTVMARVTAARGRFVSAIHLLKTASRRAEQAGYLLEKEAADRFCQRVEALKDTRHTGIQEFSVRAAVKRRPSGGNTVPPD